MAQRFLTVSTNGDAELTVLDGALNRVSRTVGYYREALDPGLYKLKVNRGGAIREQVVELGASDVQVSLYIEDFPAIAPIGSMLKNQQAVEKIAQDARRRTDRHCLFILGRWPEDSPGRPFQGLSVFPWRETRAAIDLARECRDSARIDGEHWASIAIPLKARGDTYVLEMRNGNFVSRQAIPIAGDWETRIFLRQLPDAEGRGSGYADGPPCEVSVQMARRGQQVVYWDHLETVEVARRALEAGRNIFTSEHLITELLEGKFENPIAGITGLHLLLDTLGGGADLTADHPKRALVDEVLENLTGLLQPARKSRLYADPAWAELPDMTALRLRAGRAVEKVEVSEPPLFKASWDPIKAHASSDGLSWIGRALWSVTGDANRLGPYLAWVPRRHSVAGTLAQIARQRPDAAVRPESLRRGVAAPEQPTDWTELARSYQLPLSILEPKPKAAPRRR